jgi:hypothetical protein
MKEKDSTRFILTMNNRSTLNNNLISHILILNKR